MILKKVYAKPIVLSHQPIRFETAQSWNPGKGNHDHPGTGNGGINFPPDNPNTIPCGAGTPGQGNGGGNGNSGGIGQCNPNVNP
ncbi:hypothetical protein J1P26_20945 [Neobacillus sp. MM2021_6]|uniref:hypothetical protein n=1 Tax=Bacillaceae TaxID=186817 RepID=UPI0014092090|nr:MULTISPECIES: hypothetical protein [Bacillaceae]MBO0962179.1 hypothetical protein [Neobacillus sp. MM2021_6]NHC19041.1 hypothetical protein [Bacillus sp. MM2020_4]